MSFGTLLLISINSFEVLLKPNLSVLEACKYLGLYVPKFCYHELLSIAGNCRMCLVEIKNSPKPIASCALPLVNNMVIFLNSPLVLKARENVLEALLLNHPLDCPICDQGGECDLQDQSIKYGSDLSRFFFFKRIVEDKHLNSIIKTIMSRCIHCTRCVRFSSEILGIETLGLLNRGNLTEIGNYNTNLLLSELSGNIIDLCPVGALTSKSYSFKVRPWEIRTIETIDLTDSLGSNIYINFKDLSINRIIPKLNQNINENLISDNARYFFDSFLSQRLTKFYSINKYLSISQNFLSITIKNELFSNCIENKKMIFLIDEQLDLESINLVKVLSYKYNIKTRFFKTYLYKSNFFISNFFDKIILLKKNITTFFIVSSNLKLENAILNSKLRIKFIKEDIQIYNILGTTISNFFINCINININIFLKILEGKNKLASIFTTIINPCFILGESLIKRGFSFEFIRTFFLVYLPSAFFLNIFSKCNSVGIQFSGIKSLKTKDFLKTTILVAINLKETLQVYKYCKKFSKSIYWLNTHGCFFFNKIVMTLIPMLSPLNYTGTYLNLEQKPQTSTIFFPSNNIGNSNFSMHLQNELQKLLIQSIKFSYNDFIYNIISTPILFQKQLFFNLKTSYLYKNYISNYPIKFYLEDFYLFNKFTQFSEVLSKCSYETRKISINFFKNK